MPSMRFRAKVLFHPSRTVIILSSTFGFAGNVLLLFLFGNLVLLGFLLESVFWHRVEAKNRLVGVLNQHVLALLHLETHVDNSADDSPSIIEVERHLVSEVAGLVCENTEDDVVVVVFRVCSGNESKSGQ